MSYIAPRGVIKLYKNVPLDNSYVNTLYFPSLQEQTSYFHNGTAELVKTYTNQMYQRANRGYIRVDAVADDLYMCNYMAFNNNGSPYNTKWYYAFITKVDYINEHCTELQYEIDIMQTFYFEAQVKPCFVEREHSETDELFDNIIEEDLSIGDGYVINQSKVTELSFAPNKIALLATESRTGIKGGTLTNVVDKCLNGLVLYIHGDINNINTFRTVYDDYDDKDNIVAIYQYPDICEPSFAESWTGMSPINMNIDGRTINHNINTSLTSIDGYIPRNKKLFNYPYNFILFSNYNGESYKVKYELVRNEDGTRLKNTDNIKVQCYGSLLSKPQVTCALRHYRNLPTDFESSLSISNFPEPSFASDIYKAYTAQHKATTATTIVGGIATTAVGIASLIASHGASAAVSTPEIVKGVGIAAAGVIAIGSTIGKYRDVQAQPEHAVGNLNLDGVKARENKYGFVFYPMTIHREQAEIIDNYFDMFGYAVKNVKIPNIKKPNPRLRPHWNYIKTNNCTITGAFPSDDIAKMESIYNNGITFWNGTNGTEVGNYLVDNSI